MNTPNLKQQAPASRPWRTTGFALVLLGTGFALGAASLASAGVELCAILIVGILLF